MKSLTWIVPLTILLASCPAHTGATEGESYECIVVDDAEISVATSHGLSELERNISTANFGHRIQPGSGAVLSLRVFSDKDGFSDSQYFTKITGHLEDVENIKDGVRLHGAKFSSGWSGFIYKADFWMSDNASVSIDPLQGERDVVEVSGLIDAVNYYRKEEKRFDLNFTCKLSRRTVGELSPWQGGDGNGWEYFYP
ncbi:hypothetical protein [Pseudoxanthomonas broegbernensis]|uniref:hypothetical protein n=1 Tax=Pseudoxanthomonas broegbernensis TaxID=83619 RepID=UPI001391071A|nr:hypothetical protein [Pseudoxanthomonas broegbernensis]MBB6066507.1 hypothetical protein [Pseudoxanthomonas broegbernensis]